MESHHLKALQFLGLLLTCSASLAQTTWYVDVNGTSPGSGTQNDPYTSIQYAIDQGTTVGGDVLLVLPGTYLEGIDYVGKDLQIISRDGPVVTTIDAGYMDTVVRVETGEGPATELTGFTVTGGENPGDNPPFGSAVRVFGSSLSIVNCVITRNGDTNNSPAAAGIYGENSTISVMSSAVSENGYLYQSYAAGIHLVNCSANVQGTTFEKNRGDGAVTVLGVGALFESCTFLDNSPLDSAPGGGMTVGSASVTILNSHFVGNLCLNYPGGGLFVYGSSTVSVISCEFVDNLSNSGGAVSVAGGAVELSDCLFVNNVADTPQIGTGDGGAIHSMAAVTVARSLFTGNEARGDSDGLGGYGGALFGPIATKHCTFIGNAADEAGGAAYGATIDNSIAWSNLPNELGGGAVATWSDVQGGYPGQGNIDADPLLSMNWVPLPHSPCIDAGDPDAPLDPDGTRADMGANPYTWTAMGWSYCPATVNSTGLPASLSVLGSPVPTDNWVQLLAVDASPNQYGYYLMSASQDFVPLFGGSTGNLCLGAPIIRFNNTNDGGAVLYSGPEGVFNFMPDLTNLPQGVVFQAGQTWNFQLWFRDIVNGNFTSNTSDGVAVGWL
jgi:Right handed beta helix region